MVPLPISLATNFSTTSFADHNCPRVESQVLILYIEGSHRLWSFDAKTWIPKHNHDRIMNCRPILKQIVKREQPKAIYGIAHCFKWHRFLGYWPKMAAWSWSCKFIHLWSRKTWKGKAVSWISTGPMTQALDGASQPDNWHFWRKRTWFSRKWYLFLSWSFGYQAAEISLCLGLCRVPLKRTTHDQVAFFSRLGRDSQPSW